MARIVLIFLVHSSRVNTTLLTLRTKYDFVYLSNFLEMFIGRGKPPQMLSVTSETLTSDCAPESPERIFARERDDNAKKQSPGL